MRACILNEYGGKTKFGTKNEEYTKTLNVEFFWHLTSKLSNNWMNEQ